MLETLVKWDTELFLFLNGKHNAFWDFVMYWASIKWVWIPVFLLLIYLLIREYKWKSVMAMVFVVLLITASDQISVHLFKNVFERLRPCHDPSVMGSVHLVNERCGGLFGFISSHASNYFALSVFLIIILGSRFRLFIPLILIWAAFISYSRIYLGLHYPGDVLAGAIVGSLLGVIFAGLYLLTSHINKACACDFFQEK